MLTRKTQYAWMAVGGLICLFGLVLACKLRDGNKAIAQSEQTSTPLPPIAAPPAIDEKPTPPFPFLDDPKSPEPMKAPPSVVDKDETPSLNPPSADAPQPMLEMSPPEAAPAPPSGILPASFNANTPTQKNEKKDTKKKIKDIFLFRKSLSKAKTPEAPANGTPMPKVLYSETQTPEVLYNAPPMPTVEKQPAPKPSPAAPPSTVESQPLSPVPPAQPVTEAIGVSPTSYAPPTPSSPPVADHDVRSQPGEPPLAPAPGPVQLYHTHRSESLREIARRTLGSSDRWTELHKLNPTLKPETPLAAGTTVRLPADACIQADDVDPVKPLPSLHAKPKPTKAKALPLTGTYQCTLDDKGRLTLPRSLRDQFGDSETVLLSPGPDKCLWLTNQPHLERLGERLDQSRVNEADVRDFKRLYFAQTEKLPVGDDGRVVVPERLANFAGLRQEVVLVGIDDHFEMWDAAHWRHYTQQKSGAAHSPTPAAQ